MEKYEKCKITYFVGMSWFYVILYLTNIVILLYITIDYIFPFISNVQHTMTNIDKAMEIFTYTLNNMNRLIFILEKDMNIRFSVNNTCT